MADDIEKLVFVLRQLTEGKVAGYFQIINCTAVIPPSVRFFTFDNYAYTLDEINQLGAQTIAEDGRMKDYKVVIEYQ